jgi:hypothetical protein
MNPGGALWFLSYAFSCSSNPRFGHTCGLFVLMYLSDCRKVMSLYLMRYAMTSVGD